MIDFIKTMIFNWNGSIDWFGLLVLVALAILCLGILCILLMNLIQALGFLLVKEEYKDGKITEKYYSPASSSTGVGIGMTAQGAAPVVTSNFEDETFTIEVKCDDANAGRAQVGSTCNIATYAAGSTKSGISGVAIDGSTFGTSNGSNFAVYDLSTDPDNSDYTAANANILVRINKHQFRDTTGI